MKTEGVLSSKSHFVLAALAVVAVTYAILKGPEYLNKAPAVEDKAGLSREYAYNICEQVCVQESLVVLEAINDKQVFANDGTYEFIKQLPEIGCKKECFNRIQP